MVESARSAGDPGLNPGSGRSPGEGSGYPLQDPCLGNHMERGTWRARVHGVTESSTIERLIFHFDFLGGVVVKNLHANAGEPGLIPPHRRREWEFLAWEIPWTEQSMGSQIVWHNWATEHTLTDKWKITDLVITGGGHGEEDLWAKQGQLEAPPRPLTWTVHPAHHSPHGSRFQEHSLKRTVCGEAYMTR